MSKDYYATLGVAKGDDAEFQNKVHLAMEGRGWSDVTRPGKQS